MVISLVEVDNCTKCLNTADVVANAVENFDGRSVVRIGLVRVNRKIELDQFAAKHPVFDTVLMVDETLIECFDFSEGKDILVMRRGANHCEVGISSVYSMDQIQRELAACFAVRGNDTPGH